MKKTLIGVLALMMALAVLCSACGSKDEPAAEEPTAAPQETEIPSVTAPPEKEAENEVVGADANAAPAQVNREDWLSSLSEEQRKVEDELIGESLDALIAAIGEPQSSEYATSCLVADGEDGLLYYDGFVVATTRFPNGEEFVMGTELR